MSIGQRQQQRGTRQRGEQRVERVGCDFQKIALRGVEEMEAALSGRHGIRASSLFFSLLQAIAWVRACPVTLCLALTLSTSDLPSHDAPAVGWVGQWCALSFCDHAEGPLDQEARVTGRVSNGTFREHASLREPAMELSGSMRHHVN